ncbi:TPA: hypothetical protein N0F65_004345 [Lagenidium giganteum]|uniref:Protein kinase domain-containing protein n=1 Tax=Lagenidium giganteum TaxID=4803 RepID=A0AAV2YKX8_9STRA|nr:TPA: hypothetical protein N0F65_004345 [Lagenidium giganteum]
MAIVYTALCQSHAVIVKKLLPELKANKFAREALIYEAKLVSQLDHPKIVRCVGLYWTPHGDLGLVYEPMGGTNLATFLHEYKQTLSWTSFTGEAPFRRPPKLRIALDLAEALTLLHSYDPPIVHGKLSAENVLLTSHSVAKIWNFQPVVDQNFNSFLEHVEQGITKPAGSTTCDIVAFGGLLVNLGAIDEDQAASTPKPGARMERTNSSCRVKLAELCRCCLGGRNGDHPSALQVFAELNHLHKSLGVQSHIQLGK